MKKIGFFCSLMLLLLPTAVSAQTGERTVYESKNAKVTFFDDLLGFDKIQISSDGKYLYGEAVSGEGFIYKIETGEKTSISDGNGLVLLKDPDNYVTNLYAKIDGVKYFIPDSLFEKYPELEVMTASADMQTLFCGHYIGKVGGAYGTVILNGKTGKVIGELPWVWPEMERAGYMNRTFGVSDNGKIAAGTSSAEFAFTNTSPVFWDLEAGKQFYVGIGGDMYEGTTEGYLASTNNDGSVLCGSIGQGNGHAYAIKYNQSAYTFERIAIPFWVGSSSSVAYAVSETDLVIGREETNDAIKTFLFDLGSEEKYELGEYLRDLYGLDIPSSAPAFATTNSISDNGKRMAGTANPGQEVPFLIELGESQIHAPARNAYAKQIRGTINVTVSWQAPLKGTYTLKGFNVYRDETKVNAALLAADITEFVDVSVPSGKHTYAVEAVYEDGEAAKQASADALQVIAADECLPIQEIRSSITYNRTVSLYWGLPSDRVADTKAAKGGAAKSQEEPLDFVNSLKTQSGYASAGVQIGNYIYTANFQSDEITIYHAASGVIAQKIAVENFKGARDMTAHGNSIYVVSNDKTVRELSIDPENPFDVRLGKYWDTKVNKLGHIAYIENPEGADYLALGAYNSLLFYPLNPLDENDTLAGSENFRVENFSIGGSEYYNGRLYVADQNYGAGSAVLALDIKTGAQVAVTDLVENPFINNLSGGLGFIVSGLAKSTLEDGMSLLHCLIQPYSITEQNILVNLELQGWPETTGYNVYRDNVKVNAEPLTCRHFTEDLTEAGTYKYDIEYVSTQCSGRSSDAGVTESVTIFEIGECDAPDKVKAIESNRWISVSWEDGANASGLVGYSVYRNDSLMAYRIVDHKYRDFDNLEKGKTYQYRIEAFYNNSCTASDTVTISPTFEGCPMPPSAVQVSAQKGNDNEYHARVSWELPYFETPLSYGYCNLPYASITPAQTSVCFALIGWDSADMELFDELYLVGMEFMVGTNSLQTLDAVVFADGKITLTEPIEQWSKDKWNTVYFNKIIPMKQSREIALGYVVSFDPDVIRENILVYDLGPGKRAYSDIISFDGETSTTLAAAGIDANLMINALVVRKRDLESAKGNSLQDVAAEARPLQYNDAPWQGKTSRYAAAAKTSSETVKLLGFQVYCNEEKISDERLSGFNFTSAPVKKGEDYDFAVGALYTVNGDSVEAVSDPVYLEFKDAANEGAETACRIQIAPNPAGDCLYIRSDYRSLTIRDLGGKTIRSGIEGVDRIQVSDLLPGVYMLDFTLPAGGHTVVKMIKR